MNLTLIIDIVLGILLLLFAVAGFTRGLWAEGATLVGVLLGGLLTEQWADAWGTDLSEMTGLLGRDTTRFVVRLLLFMVPLLSIGYVGALLLPTRGKPGMRTRLFGLLVGLLNGAAILGFLLRAFQYTYNSAQPDTVLMSGYVSRALLEWAGWWVLLLALGGSVAVIVALFVRAGRNRPAPIVAPAKPPATSEPGSPLRPVSGSSTGSSSLGNLDTPISGTSTPLPRPNPSSATPATSSSTSSTYEAESRPGPSDVTAAVPVSSASGSTSTATPPRTDSSRTTTRCRTCGKDLLPGAAFCTNCGTPVE